MRHLNLAMSGTEGARTFSQRAGGTLSVQKPAPVNKNTVAQIRRRGIFAAAASAYKKLRPETWAWLAAERKKNPQKDALGKTVILSVYAYFVKLYLSGWRQLPDPNESEAAAWDYVVATATGLWTYVSPNPLLLLDNQYNSEPLPNLSVPWKAGFGVYDIKENFQASISTEAFTKITIKGKTYGAIKVNQQLNNPILVFGLRKQAGTRGPAIFFRQYLY